MLRRFQQAKMRWKENVNTLPVVKVAIVFSQIFFVVFLAMWASILVVRNLFSPPSCCLLGGTKPKNWHHSVCTSCKVYGCSVLRRLWVVVGVLVSFAFFISLFSFLFCCGDKQIYTVTYENIGVLRWQTQESFMSCLAHTAG